MAPGGRFHRAAQDGNVAILREATKRDCNTKDEDGMTPTLWAAFEGNVDALRVLVGRGGDPEKCDNYGNTALHLASARAHMNCVSFLINFGVNMWALDIDMHTPKELASMNDCTDILQYLDVMASRKESEEPKKCRKQKEQAEKDAQRLLKNFQKVKEKAHKKAEKQDKELAEETKMMTIEVPTGRRESIAPTGAAAKPFSEMVGISSGGPGSSSSSSFAGTLNAAKSKKLIGTVLKRAAVKKARVQEDTFKVRGEESNGAPSVRQLRGLRRDSEIMFAAPVTTEDKEHDDKSNNSANSLVPPPGAFAHRRDTFGIFDRPGFGSVAFRRPSMANFEAISTAGSTGDLGSGGHSLTEDEDEEDEEESPQVASTALDMFLAGLGLQQYIRVFRRHQVDLESLMLLTERHLMEMNIEVGPRMKIMNAIEERKADMAKDRAMEDTKI